MMMLSQPVATRTDQHKLAPNTHIGAVQLTVANLARAITFYEQVVGLTVHEQRNGQANLGVGGPNLVELVEVPNARQVTQHSGLYHFALLTPSRVALARVLRNLVDHGVRLGGSDHLVSEALYFSDPDGNGIEVYRDRPREEWQYANGFPLMGGEPLDYEGLLQTLAEDASPWQGIDAATVMGHMHLHVSDLSAALTFYREVVGFELTMDWNQASFLSAGGYHHHLGINTWAGVGAPPQPADAVGLRHYVIVLATEAERDALRARLAQAGVAHEARPDGLFVRDPAQNGILLVVDNA